MINKWVNDYNQVLHTLGYASNWNIARQVIVIITLVVLLVGAIYIVDFVKAKPDMNDKAVVKEHPILAWSYQNKSKAGLLLAVIFLALVSFITVATSKIHYNKEVANGEVTRLKKNLPANNYSAYVIEYAHATNNISKQVVLNPVKINGTTVEGGTIISERNDDGLLRVTHLSKNDSFNANNSSAYSVRKQSLRKALCGLLDDVGKKPDE